MKPDGEMGSDAEIWHCVYARDVDDEIMFTNQI